MTTPAERIAMSSPPGVRAAQMTLRRAVSLVGLILLAGCASLTPSQQKVLAELRALAEATAGTYRLPRVRVFAGELPRGVAARYRCLGSTIVVRPELVVDHPFTLAVMAHELGHYVLQHCRRPAVPKLVRLFELDANERAVEVLTRVRGLPEAQALRLVYAYLLAQHRAGGPSHESHALPCDEIQQLLERFPQHRAWTASLVCAAGHASEQIKGIMDELQRLGPPREQ